MHFILFKKKKKDRIKGDNIELNVLAYSETESSTFYNEVVDDFNAFAEENDINVRLKITIHTNQDSFEAFANSVESLLKKRINKYDLYYFDNGYTIKYGPYLLDIKDYISDDIIDMHDSRVVDYTCRYENKLIGLVIKTKIIFLL